MDERLGNSRLLWLLVEPTGTRKLHICFAYLPASDDDDWIMTLSALERDLQTILDRYVEGSLRRVIVMGDFNYEPQELGGATQRPTKRRRALAKFMNEWGLELHNPDLNGDPQEITLPLRDRLVCIKEGTTRHGRGVGSSIDLGLSTTDMKTDLLVHNSLHYSREVPCVIMAIVQRIHSK